MARPQKKLNEEQIIQVEGLASVLSVEQMAEYFGFEKTTFYRICERQPEVLQRYKKGKSKAINSVGKGLLEKARSGDTTAQMFYLKTQAGWKEKQDINHTSDDGSMSPKELNINNMSSKEIEHGYLDLIKK